MQLPNSYMECTLTILLTKIVNEIQNCPKKSHKFDEDVKEKVMYIFTILK